MKSREGNLLIFIGILLLVIMWIVEINFHYFAGFKPENFEDEALFWQAELAQLANTFGFMLVGILCIWLGIRIRK